LLPMRKLALQLSGEFLRLIGGDAFIGYGAALERKRGTGHSQWIAKML
jgi:hypothetical protein